MCCLLWICAPVYHSMFPNNATLSDCTRMNHTALKRSAKLAVGMNYLYSKAFSSLCIMAPFPATQHFVHGMQLPAVTIMGLPSVEISNLIVFI